MEKVVDLQQGQQIQFRQAIKVEEQKLLQQEEFKAWKINRTTVLSGFIKDRHHLMNLMLTPMNLLNG